MGYTDYFNDVLSAVGNEKQLDNDSLLAIAREKGLDDENLAALQNAFTLIDNTTAKADEMNNARRAGTTKAAFVEEEIRRLTDTMAPEEQEAIVTAIEKTAEKAVEQLSTED